MLLYIILYLYIVVSHFVAFFHIYRTRVLFYSNFWFCFKPKCSNSTKNQVKCALFQFCWFWVMFCFLSCLFICSWFMCSSMRYIQSSFKMKLTVQWKWNAVAWYKYDDEQRFSSVFVNLWACEFLYVCVCVCVRTRYFQAWP